LRTLSRSRFVHQQRGINIDPEEKTLSQFVTSWLESVRRDVAPATYISYESAVRIHLNPFLGHLLLSKLTASHVQEFKEAKLREIRTNCLGVTKPSDDEVEMKRHLSGQDGWLLPESATHGA
jgi:hypothetical protein